MERKICLDTDVIIDFISQRDHAKVGELFGNQQNNLVVSAVTAFELRLREYNQAEVELFLKGVQILPFDNESSRVAAKVSRELRKAGTPVSLADILIASSCMNFGFVLLTNNKSDFSKVKGLTFA